MFTGIVAGLGRVGRLDRHRLSFAVPDGFELKPGDSVAVNGTCLTAVAFDGGLVGADLSPETLSRTALGGLEPNEPVNLELPLRAADRLGGHFVQGHVDAVGHVERIEPEGESYRFVFRVDARWDRYLVEKGSVTVDGISLTAFDVRDGAFAVAVIPHTFRHTNLGSKRVGDLVNVEFDVLGKYAEKLLAARLQA